MGGGGPYSEPSQQVEEAEVAGESFTHHCITTARRPHHPHARTVLAVKGATFDPRP